MQLRKVCNHPNLFEARPTVSPLVCAPLATGAASAAPPMLAQRALRFDPLREVDYRSGPLCLSAHEATVSAFTAFTLACLKGPSSYDIRNHFALALPHCIVTFGA